MKASEMTNEELAKALMSRIPLDSDRHDDLREAAARLRLKQQSDNYAAELCRQGVEYKREICDRMNREVEISTAQMERIVRDAILSYEELYKEAPNDDVEREIYERCAIAQGWLVAHGFERQEVSFDKEESPNL